MVEICPICGHGIMAAVLCPKYEVPIHDTHCKDCPYHVEMFYHCRFRQDTLEKARLLEAKEKEKARMARIRAAFMAAVNKKGAPA
ncbi:MAG: hypothetical protein ACTTJE_04960 [Schwartzia sp. (in: firmicutes)]